MAGELRTNNAWLLAQFLGDVDTEGTVANATIAKKR
jgi:hypothetical protein